MANIKCPKCGEIFNVDDSELSSIVSQIRDAEFEKDLSKRVSEMEKHLEEKHDLELESQDVKLRAELQKDYEKELERVKEELRDEKEHAKELQNKIDTNEDQKRLAVLEAVQKVEREKHDLESELNSEKERHKILMDEKDKEIELYKDMKIRMSTKMVGESLEQYCENEFNKYRMTAFKNAYFEKDNDARTGSKGDFIYREMVEDDESVELLSIMFEMKNEIDTTLTKHKNEDFFKELDKDRNEKGCEYAVLVSLLESDSDLYNSGIVDVSYKYDKMYVVRPQCFIPMITILRNAAMTALDYKKELIATRNQNIDITNFEDKLNKFKNDFGRNYELAHSHFDKAIDEIDKTIDHLQKVKKELQGSDNQLRLANGKVEDVSIKRLTRGNPTMQAMFENK